MKRLFLFLFLMTGMAFGQTTTYTGTIKDLSLNPVTSGQVAFTLAQPVSSTIPGTGVFVPSEVDCNINADGTLSGGAGGACIVASNTAISPSGTAYRICVQPYYSTPGSCFYDYATTASKDITTVAPTLQTGPLNYNGVPGPPLNVAGIWSSTQTYKIGDVVISAGITYLSLASPNLNQAPASSTTYWSVLQVSVPANGAVEIALQPGGDLGAKINASIAAYPGGALLHLRSGTYAMTTTATVNPLLFSIMGDGPNLTHIICSIAGTCIEIAEPTWSSAPAGVFSNFSISGTGVSGPGTGAANAIGLYLYGGMISPQIDNVQIYYFSGTNSAGIYINNFNSNANVGFTEQSHLYQVALVSNTVGLKLACDTANTASCSFGYSMWDIHFNVLAGQIGIQMNSGRLYNSNLAFRFNNTTLATANIQLNASAYGSNMDSNTWDITGEGGGPGIIAAAGTRFTGTGQLSGFVNTFNEAAPTFGATYSVGPSSAMTPDYGTIANFNGTANTATPFVFGGFGTALSGFMTGTNIQSPFVSMYGGAPNIFGVYECPSGATSVSQCTLVHSVDNGGNTVSNGTSTGKINNSYGMQIATAAACTSTATALSTCPVTVTMPVPEPDTAYRVTGCQLDSPAAAVIATNPGNFTTTTFSVTLVSTGTANAGFGTVACLVTHN